MATKRTALSKKTRFEVFKRDGFKCQYCGAHPPSVLLEVDHIVPVAGGGKNHMDNLVTACEPCNQGKGARALTVVPESLDVKAASVKEREEQLRGFHDVMEAKRERIEAETWRVLEELHCKKLDTVSRDEFASTKRFIEKLGVHEALEAAEIAVAAPIPHYKAFKYFCGICWNKVRKQEGNA
jgi:hypothetical protein